MAAYLTISTNDFSIGIEDALRMLREIDSQTSVTDKALAALQSGFSATGSAAQSIFAPMLSAAAQLASTAAGNMQQTVQAALSGVGTSFSQAASTSSTSAQQLSTSVSDCAENIGTRLAYAAQSAGTSGASMGDAMRTAATAVADAMRSAMSSVDSFLETEPTARANSERICDAVTAPFEGVGGTLSSYMSNAGDSMASALASKASAIVSVAQSIAASVTSTIKSALQIASPSKVMRKLGTYTAEGLALGISDMAPQVEKSAQRLALAAQAGADTRLELTAGIAAAPSQGNYSTAREMAGTELSELGSRLERLIELISDKEQVMRVDGRAFGRLVREYVT